LGEGGRNDPNIVCTYELKKKKDQVKTLKNKRLAIPNPHGILGKNG
jgi:hypothetical protein